MNIIKNKTFGAPLTLAAINNPDKIFNPNKTDTLAIDAQNINVLLYTGIVGDSTYYVGTIMFTDNPQIVRGYANLLFIDVADVVANRNDVLEMIKGDFTTFLTQTTNRNNCLGFAAAPQNRNVQQNMIAAGLKPSEVNKEIIITKI